MIRTATSFDIHRLEPGDGLILGGVFVPCAFKAVAHSDGDCVLHALSEAIFAALGLDDLGSHFPDSDPSTKGLDSAVILAAALTAAEKRGARVVHAAVHILLEQPKLKAYKSAVKGRLMQLLDLGDDSVAVHAGTTEGLGPVGQSDAVAAFASVTISDSK